MPIDVNIIRIIKAVVKYTLSSTGIFLKFLYNQEATTNLDASNSVPIIKIGTTAEAKMATRPITE